jgi:hypothetical protein
MNEPTAPPGITEEPSISNPERPLVRLRGSHSSTQPIEALRPALRTALRPIDDDDPLPHDPPDLPPPPPAVSTPDLGLQISFCLPPNLVDGLVAAVKSAIDPNADVRTACVNGSQHVGIWLRPSVSEADNQARGRGLDRLNILHAGETLAFFINAGLIRRQAIDGWNAAPKRRDGSGNPDPNGPVHLTGFSVDFQSPNRIVTRITGFDERPWPDVDFTLTATDTFSVSGGQVHVDSARDLDVDTSWLNFLTGLFLVVLPPLGVVFLVERIIVGSKDAPDIDAGAGAGAAAMIPVEILIPGGQKVVASYSRVEVSSGGVFAGGTFEVIARTPEVSISGPTLISIVEGTAAVSRAYRANMDDLRPPLQISWSGDGLPLNQGQESSSFRFNLSGAQVGQVLSKRVAVQVTDADGLSGSAQLVAQIHITPEDDGDFPPVCKVKPWLPQCKEPLAKAASLRRMEQV